jgi:hypothetical protein
VKNPENIRLIMAAITFWILRCAQNDKLYFPLQELSTFPNCIPKKEGGPLLGLLLF